MLKVLQKQRHTIDLAARRRKVFVVILQGHVAQVADGVPGTMLKCIAMLLDVVLPSQSRLLFICKCQSNFRADLYCEVTSLPRVAKIGFLGIASDVSASFIFPQNALMSVPFGLEENSPL